MPGEFEAGTAPETAREALDGGERGREGSQGAGRERRIARDRAPIRSLRGLPWYAV
jgi:hypothetical protein